jgi:hypothetical protein
MARRTAHEIEEEDEDGFDLNDDLSDLNDPDIENLPDPPEIGGPAIGGRNGTHMPGRPVVPRMFAVFASNPSVATLAVYRYDEGRPVSLGTIPAEATEGDFIRRFFDSMPKRNDGTVRYEVRACDLHGKPLGPIQTLHFDYAHPMITRIRNEIKEESVSNAAPAYATAVAPERIDANHPIFLIMKENLDAARAQAAALQAQLESDRKALNERRDQLTENEIGLAAKATEVTQRMADKFIAEDQARADRLLKESQNQSATVIEMMKTIHDANATQTGNFASQQILFMQAKLQEEQNRRAAEIQEASERAKAERERIKAEADAALERSRQEHAQTIERERIRAEDEKRRRDEMLAMERDTLRARLDAEREMDRQRREDERRRADAYEAERARKHELELAAMQNERAAARERAAAELEALKEQARLAHELRMAQFNRGGDLEGLLTKGAGLLGMFGVEPQDAVRKLLGGETEVVEQRSPVVDMITAIAPKVIEVFGQVARAAVTAQTQAPRPQLGPPAPSFPLPGAQRPREAVPIQAHAAQAPAAAPQPLPSQPDDAAQSVDPVGAPADAPQLDAMGALALETQKAARLRLRELIQKLSAAPEADWFGLIAFYNTSYPEIQSYLRTISIYKAAIEAHASEDMAKKIINFLDPILPKEIERY